MAVSVYSEFLISQRHAWSCECENGDWARCEADLVRTGIYWYILGIGSDCLGKYVVFHGIFLGGSGVILEVPSAVPEWQLAVPRRTCARGQRAPAARGRVSVRRASGAEPANDCRHRESVVAPYLGQGHEGGVVS